MGQNAKSLVLLHVRPSRSFLRSAAHSSHATGILFLNYGYRPLLLSFTARYLQHIRIQMEADLKVENTLRALYVDALHKLHDAEDRLIQALPKMAEASNSAKLRSGFEMHLEQTKVHAYRLDQILFSLGADVNHKKCKAMEGLVSEGSEIIGEDFEGPVKDAGLISAAQRVEHYEIAAYRAVHAFAEILDDQTAVSLLAQTLQEEKETDEKLTTLAQSVNLQANGGSSHQADESLRDARSVGV